MTGQLGRKYPLINLNNYMFSRLRDYNQNKLGNIVKKNDGSASIREERAFYLCCKKFKVNKEIETEPELAKFRIGILSRCILLFFM